MRQGARLFDNADVLAIPDRQFRVLNALDLSIHRCLFKYEAIYQIIEQDRTELNRNLVLLVWELIDWFERSRRIMNLGTGFGKNVATRKAKDSLKKVENLRHTLPHFDNFVKGSAEVDFAPLGAVTAIHRSVEKEFRVLVFNPGTVRGATNLGKVRIPEKTVERVDHVTLLLEGQELNVSAVARDVLDYYEELRNQISKSFPEKPLGDSLTEKKDWP